MTRPDVVDVLIAGGGYAGQVAARELVNAGRSVVMVDRRSRAGYPPQSTSGLAREWIRRFDLPVGGETTPLTSFRMIGPGGEQAVLGGDHFPDYQIMATLLQGVWILGLWALLYSVRKHRWAIALCVGTMVFAGFTIYIGLPQYKRYTSAPIKLQAHGDPSPPISFRNIWVRDLARDQ